METSSQAFVEQLKDAPEFKKRLGRAYALLLRLKDKTPSAQAARPDAPGDQDDPAQELETQSGL